MTKKLTYLLVGTSGTEMSSKWPNEACRNETIPRTISLPDGGSPGVEISRVAFERAVEIIQQKSTQMSDGFLFLHGKPHEYKVLLLLNSGIELPTFTSKLPHQLLIL